MTRLAAIKQKARIAGEVMCGVMGLSVYLSPLALVIAPAIHGSYTTVDAAVPLTSTQGKELVDWGSGETIGCIITQPNGQTNTLVFERPLQNKATAAQHLKS